MNAKRQGNGQIDRLYWGVSPTTLAGVVDQVRTTLTAMAAEMRATMPEGTEVPPPDVANNAYHVAVEGSKRTTVNFAAATDGSTVTTTDPERRSWSSMKVAWVVLGGLVTIAGVLFALMQAQGWEF
jgi:AbiTii